MRLPCVYISYSFLFQLLIISLHFHYIKQKSQLKKETGKLSFWKKIRFKYKLSFLNENTLAEVFTLKISALSGILIVAAFAVLLITITSVVIVNTPIRNYLPGYLDSEIRQDMMKNALKTDSLEQLLNTQSLYLNSVTSILRGDIDVEEMQNQDSATVSVKVEDLKKSEELTEFIKNFEEEEKYNLNILSTSTALPDNLIFYQPARGIISAPFDQSKKHYGVDIAATPKESVLATMSGTVIFTGFDANAGYVIQLQHNNGFVSIYKHNAILLKKQGNEVIAGEAIAIVGNTGILSSGHHLHFELWYKGSPVNPENFIAF